MDGICHSPPTPRCCIPLLLALLCGCAPTTGLLPADEAGDLRRQLLAHYQDWRGVPYRWGGNGRAGIDCSAFVQLTFKRLFALHLPRTTEKQAESGRPVPIGGLSAGDIVFFKTGWRQRHNGIYLGRGEFVHASASRGIIKSSLRNRYWNRRYWKAVRVWEDEPPVAATAKRATDSVDSNLP